MIRVIIAGLLMLSGLFVLGIATLGIFRFSTMLNRIHVAAKCDTLGALLVLSGLIVLSGWSVFSLKMGLVIVFLWLCNPAASHLVARAEVKTNPDLSLICDFIDLTPHNSLLAGSTPLNPPLAGETRGSVSHFAGEQRKTVSVNERN
ncbi:MAG: monovalent cation/H(+) antiporter subunit G [Synergistaceae bacterium]|nr:monovalent cation/H(+) antiporter subunit G [Synergistaceae bacterium]